MNDRRKVKTKVILLGDESVGKTSLIRRYVLDNFNDEYIQTLGTKVTKKTVNMVCEDGAPVETTMMIWDIVGQHKVYGQHLDSFHSYQPQTHHFMGSKGALLVCDLTRRETFDKYKIWVDSIMKEIGLVPMVFLGNKADLKGSYQVTAEELKRFAEGHWATSFMTSAKTGQNVENAFTALAQVMTRNIFTSDMRRDPQKAARSGLRTGSRPPHRVPPRARPI